MFIILVIVGGFRLLLTPLEINRFESSAHVWDVVGFLIFR